MLTIGHARHVPPLFCLSQPASRSWTGHRPGAFRKLLVQGCVSRTLFVIEKQRMWKTNRATPNVYPAARASLVASVLEIYDGIHTAHRRSVRIAAAPGEHVLDSIEKAFVMPDKPVTGPADQSATAPNVYKPQKGAPKLQVSTFVSDLCAREVRECRENGQPGQSADMGAHHGHMSTRQRRALIAKVTDHIWQESQKMNMESDIVIVNKPSPVVAEGVDDTQTVEHNRAIHVVFPKLHDSVRLGSMQ